MTNADNVTQSPMERIPPELEAKIKGRGGAATIYDIAQLAGVSPSTVSRALSKPGRISEKTEAKVRAAAVRLHFQFNPQARALHTGHSHTLGLLVADITNPVIFDIVRGAERAASTAGYTLIIAESQESSEAEAEAVSRMMQSVDGLVLATTRLADEQILALAERKPVVLINRHVGTMPSVLSDVRSGVAEVVNHLADLGHTALAYASGPPTSWISRQRWECLLEEATRRDIAIVEIGPNSPSIDGGTRVLRRVLAARSTAVIAFNDLMAIGIIQAASASGVAIPTELSVTGFDDIFGSELIVPSLTTVLAQLELAGTRAVETLVSIAETNNAPADGEALKTTLIVRNSSGPARAHGTERD